MHTSEKESGSMIKQEEQTELWNGKLSPGLAGVGRAEGASMACFSFSHKGELYKCTSLV